MKIHAYCFVIYTIQSIVFFELLILLITVLMLNRSQQNKQLVKFNARTDVHEAADTLCIYFDDPTMFAPEKIVKGYEYMAERTSREIQLHHIICVVNSAKGLEIKTFDFQ